MFNWEGCPVGLFDIYMEVGEVIKAANGETEVWIGSSFARKSLRPECAQIRRRPVYGVIKQIRKLGGGEKSRISFMCDDEESGFGNDTENQAVTIALLLRQLMQEGLVERSTLYTRKSLEDIEKRGEGDFRREEDRELYQWLFETVDRLETCCPNPYVEE